MRSVITSIGDFSALDGDDRVWSPRQQSMDEMMSIADADQDTVSIDLDDGTYPSDFEPNFIPSTGPVAMAIPEPGPGGSLTAKPAGWARGDGTYIVQAGDTMSGLARLYLGNAARFPEIWNIQSSAYRSKRKSADNIVVGDVLTMPNEAVLQAQHMGVFTPKVPTATSSPAPAPPHVASTTPKPSAAVPASHKKALGIGAALAAGLGVLMWPKHRPQKARKSTKRRRRR